MKKLLFILAVFSNLFSYQICESYVDNSYYVSCLNGVEFLRYNAYYGAGLTKTGYSCKCVYSKGFVAHYKVKRLNK